MPNLLQVEVVAAEGKVWEGQAVSLIARTTEGDIGILADHEPFMAAPRRASTRSSRCPTGSSRSSVIACRS